MTKYLCEHRISVFVTTAVLVMLGVLAYRRIPTSLLPDISIPEIVVQVQEPELSAAEMERQVVMPLRHRLTGMNRLRDIHSTAQDGMGEVRLSMAYGTRMDLAYVEANEKVDAAMMQLPQHLKRPRVMRVNTADIPVFTLMVTRKQGTANPDMDHLEMSESVQQLFKPRLDQLSEVAMVDVSGGAEKELQLVPHAHLMEQLGLTVEDLKRAIEAQQIEGGVLSIQEKGRFYDIRLNAEIQRREDVAAIPVQRGGRIFTLGELADIAYQPAPMNGQVIYNGKPAVALAVIKQQAVRMEQFQAATTAVLSRLEKEYPQYDFRVCNDQAGLLQETLSSLTENLCIGLILVLLVSLCFLRDMRIPLVVAVSMGVALVISVGALYVADISLNIISLVGLILAVGMMIDNALIATDEIAWYHQQGCSSLQACVQGIGHVLTPMLSSMLTTVAVFLPLLFTEGLAGVLFHDQAWSITICLVVSYGVAIFFLPVLYHALLPHKSVRSVQHSLLLKGYDRGTHFVFRYRKWCLFLVAASLPACVWLFGKIHKESIPSIRRHEMVAHITWPRGTQAVQTVKYTQQLLAASSSLTQGSYAYAGAQDFILTNGLKRSAEYTRWTLCEDSTGTLEQKMRHADSLVHALCPPARLKWTAEESVMEKLFPTASSGITLRVYERFGTTDVKGQPMTVLGDSIGRCTQSAVVMPPKETFLVAEMNHELMNRYGVTPDAVRQSFGRVNRRSHLATLHDFNAYVPIYAGRTDSVAFHEWLYQDTVVGEGGNGLPLHRFVRMGTRQAPAQLESDIRGTFTSMMVVNPPMLSRMKEVVKTAEKQFPHLEMSLTGDMLEHRRMIRSLGMTLALSVVLIYLILTAQFGSFTQPLIVLAEIPVDLAAGLAALWLAGMSVNVMSAIGLIVACGVVVNDSILKLNAINLLCRQGMSTLEAIHKAGQRRLRAIIMTSLTSILALLPVLWSSDMGSELQKPFAVALIAAMTVGTLVSVFVIPLLYALFFVKK